MRTHAHMHRILIAKLESKVAEVLKWIGIRPVEWSGKVTVKSR